MADPLSEVVFSASKEVVDANHIVTHQHQAIHEVGPNKAGALVIARSVS
jgi:hypothetical protein